MRSASDGATVLSPVREASELRFQRHRQPNAVASRCCASGETGPGRRAQLRPERIVVRRLRLAILAAVMLAGLAVTPASAAQTQTNVYVVAFHWNLQQDLFAVYGAPCNGTSCAVTIAVSSRDYGMVTKQCGGATVTVHIAYPASGSGVYCPGSGNWAMQVSADLRDANGDFIQADTAVDVVVTVVKGGTSLL
jgi:hypothetical protein